MKARGECISCLVCFLAFLTTCRTFPGIPLSCECDDNECCTPNGCSRHLKENEACLETATHSKLDPMCPCCDGFDCVLNPFQPFTGTYRPLEGTCRPSRGSQKETT